MKINFRKILKVIILSLIVCIVIIVCTFFGASYFLKGGEYKGSVSDHFDGKIFSNIYVKRKKTSVVFGWARFLRVFRERKSWPDWVESEYGPKPITQLLNSRSNIRYTVVNHSTVLIQIKGLNILTDPIWSKRCSPLSWIGPSRVINPGIKFDDLPPIDLVLISHNHYDHMDLPTLKRLNKKFKPLFLVGLGNAVFLRSEGLENVKDLDWWDSINMGESEVHFVPAQHWSNRTTFDARASLWGGFVIQSKSRNNKIFKIFFAGDTGYSPHFKDIYNRFGPMDISFLPIGSYEPRSFMRIAHNNPEDSVVAHLDLKSRRSVGIHRETFQLTNEAYYDPRKDLAKALRKRNIDSRYFIVPEFGQAIEE